MEASRQPNTNPPRDANGNGTANGGAATANGARPTFPPTKAQQYRLPYHPQPPRPRRRRGCCCVCCLWLTLFLIALVFLAAIAAGVVYVLYRPQRPTFSVSSLRLVALNLSAADLLTSRLDLSVTARNPNRKLVFVYDDVAISASSGGVTIGEGTIPGFAQGTDNTTVLKTTVSSSGRSLDPTEASDLRKRKRYPLEIEFDTKAGVKIGGFKSKRLGIRASCDGIEAMVAKGNATAAATTTGYPTIDGRTDGRTDRLIPGLRGERGGGGTLSARARLFLVFAKTSSSPTRGTDRVDTVSYEARCSSLRDHSCHPYVKEASSFSSTPEESYDYIIVGGGTAGCPLAATLSQNYSVLLLERGGSPYGNHNISYLHNFLASLVDTSPASPSQRFISTDGVINARARVLGGGTCINAGFYTRASSSFVEEAGWDGKLVNESYLWVEKRIVYWPEVAPWQAALRDGLLGAGVSPFNGYTYDHLYGTKIGGTIFDKDGFRHTAADLLDAGNPQNLRVLLHASVQKVIFDPQGRQPQAVGIQFKDESGKERKALLKDPKQSEVILSSGTIGSPQLLLLSGIGTKKELEKLNIPVVIDNPDVGNGMSDNPMNTVFMPTKEPVQQSLIQTVGITRNGVFIEASSGFGLTSDGFGRHHGIISAEIGQLSTTRPKERSLEAAEKYARDKRSLPSEAFQGGFILQKIDVPRSKGHLSLVDSDVDNNPSVTFNYFSHPDDLQRCVSGIRSIEQIVRTKHFADLTVDDTYTMEKLINISVPANMNLMPNRTDDTASLEQFCKDSMLTIWHYHGGCHVGKVVDGEYRVLGVSGLRVVDSSAFHRSPGTNPQATVMMMGRYGRVSSKLRY
ncbi:hypothetical protein BHE74_00018150 [Ensete ventricosum]|nr:hypothetical protein BHE74_00018150 [Ensete ventricosum]